MRNPLRIFLCGSLIFFLGAFGNAQVKLTGSVNGRVLDVDTNPLPGCTVTIEGPALQGTMSFVTVAEGHFRFPALPPGTGYQCTFEIPGFRTVVRKGLIVNVGKSTNVAVTLSMSTLEEEVTVVGESPTVDVKVSKTAVNYSKNFIHNIPLERDLYSVLNSIPGSIPASSVSRTSYIAGGTVRGNQYNLDGVNINNPLTMPIMTNINIDVYEEVEMELYGHPAEIAHADGGFVNIVSKSGGDEFHGGATIEYYNEDMQQSLISEEDLDAVGLEKPTGWNSWQDYSLFLGGPFVRDRLWFFANARYYKWNYDFSHVVWDDTLAAGQRIFSLAEYPHEELNFFGKLTFQLSSQVRLTASYNFVNFDEENRGSSNLDKTSFTKRVGDNVHTMSGQLNWVLSQNLFLDARMGYIRSYWPYLNSGNAINDAPRNYDRYYNMSRNNTRFNETYTQWRINPSCVATLFLDNFLNAAHEIKLGAEFENSNANWDFWRENPWLIYYYKGSIYGFGSNFTFIETGAYGNTEGSTVQRNGMRRFGFFIQDSVTIAGRLTLNLGARFDTSTAYFLDQYHSEVHDPYGLLPVLKGNSDLWDEYTLEGMDALTWSHLSPRLGFSFDVFGDGKTSFRASWSRYNEYLMMQYSVLANPFGYFGGGWIWFDVDYNEIIEPTDYFQMVYLNPNVSGHELEKTLDTEASAPYTDEWSVGIEREVAQDFSMSLIFAYKHKQNIFEDVNDLGLGKEEAWKGYSENSPYFERIDILDPGDDGEFGTDDDQMSYFYAILADSPDWNQYVTNVKRGFRKYWALNLIFNKRMSNNWQLLGSIVYSKAWGNIGGSFGQTYGASGRFDDPNTWLFTPGRLDYDRPWNFKLQSTVILPYDFILSGYFNHLSGAPWARTVTVDTYGNKYKLRTYTIPTEVNGTRRNAPLTTLDLRFEKRFRVGESFYIGGYIDIMNVFANSGFEISSDPGGYIDYSDPENPTFTRYGTYGSLNSAYGTRIVKVSLRFTF
jgi:hypothetical protein